MALLGRDSRGGGRGVLVDRYNVELYCGDL